MAGFIAMVSVMVVVAIEMVFATKGAGHSHGEVDLETLRAGGSGGSGTQDAHHQRSGSFKPFRQEAIGVPRHTEEDVEEMYSMQPRSPYSDSPGSVDKPLPPPPAEDDNDSDLDLGLDELEHEEAGDDTTLLNGRPKYRNKRTLSDGSPNGRPNQPSRNVSFASPVSTAIPPSPTSATTMQAQRLILQCLLLEAGILFHSVFIGMALSVSTGPAFVVLLIAISFHQTFEGLALGSRIAAIPSFSTTSLKPWLMSVLYGITTPIGQAIGLGVHTLYDPASQFGLLMVGIVNAISAGLLLYAGLVQLLAEDFLSDQSYIDLHGRKRLEACAAVFAGSMLMAFVGACKCCLSCLMSFGNELTLCSCIERWQPSGGHCECYWIDVASKQSHLLLNTHEQPCVSSELFRVVLIVFMIHSGSLPTNATLIYH